MYRRRHPEQSLFGAAGGVKGTGRYGPAPPRRLPALPPSMAGRSKASRGAAPRLGPEDLSDRDSPASVLPPGAALRTPGCTPMIEASVERVTSLTSPPGRTVTRIGDLQPMAASARSNAWRARTDLERARNSSARCTRKSFGMRPASVRSAACRCRRSDAERRRWRNDQVVVTAAGLACFRLRGLAGRSNRAANRPFAPSSSAARAPRLRAAKAVSQGWASASRLSRAAL